MSRPGGAGKGSDDLSLDGNSVCVNFTIECFAYRDSVVVAIGGTKFAFGRVEPELHAIQKMEVAPINDRRGPRLFFDSEENRRAEEALEAFDQAAVVGTVFGKVEEFEHLRGRIEMNFTRFLAQSERGDPDREEAILPERQP